MMVRLFPLILILLNLTACEKIALMTTSKKKAQISHSKLATTAEQKFWTTLHDGNYLQIPEATKFLTAAYLENPNDPNLAAHLGFLHIWKITERNRLSEVPPTIVDEIILARKYFKDAYELNANDARTLGFLADSILVEGKIFADKRKEVHGYFMLKDAIRKWPEFNYFSGGFVMSDEPSQSTNFKEGLEWQWRTLDLCAQQKINRSNPDYSPYMRLATQEGPKRACWNSWIAPHNFEGFFLNMGDMLVKAGDWQTAIKIYNNAKLSPDYKSWPFQNFLDNRIKNAKRNVNEFNQAKNKSADDTILFRSGFGCVACHQKNGDAKIELKHN